ncbi:MAG: hypothetical protein ACYDGR_11850 [Candidatus Dormibacteria bacterium]
MRVRFAVMLLVALVITLVSGVSVIPARVAAAQGAITFETPVVTDPIHVYGEPDVAVNPANGHIFVSGPAGTGTQRSIWTGSVDNGHTYRVISAGPPPSDATSITAGGPGGGDTDIAFDHTGKQYFSDLYALLCFRQAVTSDDGATVAQQSFPGGCAGAPQGDRQWFSVWDPPAGTPNTSLYKGPFPLIYFVYNIPSRITKTTDGLNYTEARVDTTNSPFGPDGYPAQDQVTGKIFRAAASGNDLKLNIGTPDASGNMAFLDDGGAASKLIKIAHFAGGSPSQLFDVVSMDSARNLWVTAVVNNSSKPALEQVFVSVSRADSGWTQWATPVQVSQPPSLTNIFPWMVAGGPGRADSAWYGSDKAVDPSTAAGQKWNTFMSQTVWPTDSTGAVILTAKPSVTQVKVSPHPMKYDDICLAGTGCIAQQGNRNLADFFAITKDKEGAAQIVYADTSNGLAQTGFTPANQQIADHAGAAVVTVAKQNGGPGLFGTDINGPSAAPRRSLAGKPGTAKYTLGSTSNGLFNGTNVPGMNILSSSLDLAPGVLKVTMDVGDLSNPSATNQAVGGPFLQYVTRWQMGNDIYYAAMENTAANSPLYYAGKASSADLCSVSACDPHIINYPESPLGTTENGSIKCPSSPSPTNPCTLTINVNLADIGSPTQDSLLEEVGAYSFTSANPSTVIATNGVGNSLAQNDTVPLEIDGVCCYNFQSSYRAVAAAPTVSPVATSTPVTPSPAATPPLPNTSGRTGNGLPLALVLLITAGPVGILAWAAERRRRAEL